MIKRERESGIELLRIVCILLIIAQHYVLHGNYPEVNTVTFSWQCLFLQIVCGGGSMACDVFILITGFYMIDRESVSMKKSVVLIGEMLFYSLLGLAVSVCVLNQNYSIAGLIKTAFPILWGNWFCMYYIVFSIFIPYINKGLNALSRQQYLRLVIAVIAVWSIIPTITGHAWKFGDFDTFVFMYVVGGYLGKYYKSNKTEMKKAIAVVILCTVGYIISVTGMDFLGMKLNKVLFLEKAMYLRNISSIVSVPLAISLVLIFKEIKFKSKIVNTISGSVLGVYLLHDNAIVRDIIWNKWSPNGSFIVSPYLPIHFIAKVLIIFSVCVLVDIVRKYTIEQLLIKHIKM